MISKGRWLRRKSAYPETLWSAVAEFADVPGSGLVTQALQQLAAAVKHLKDDAKVAAERHAADIASLRDQLDSCHREAAIQMQVLQEELQHLRTVAMLQVDSTVMQGENEISTSVESDEVESVPSTGSSPSATTGRSDEVDSTVMQGENEISTSVESDEVESVPSTGSSPSATTGRSDEVVKPPPEVLRFRCPNWQKECDGTYDLVKDEVANGRLLWKMRDGKRWLYLTTDENWGVGGQREFDENFNCNNSYVFRPHTMGVRSPDLLPKGWMLFDGQGWRCDPEVVATEEEPVRGVQAMQENPQPWEADGSSATTSLGTNLTVTPEEFADGGAGSQDGEVSQDGVGFPVATTVPEDGSQAGKNTFLPSEQSSGPAGQKRTTCQYFSICDDDTDDGKEVEESLKLLLNRLTNSSRSSSFNFNTLATEFVPGADAWLQSNCAGQQSPKCEAFDIGSEEEDHTCKAAHHAWSLSASTDWTATGRSDKVESALMQKIEKETSKNRKVGPVLQQCSSGAAGDGDGKKVCRPDGKTTFLPSEHLALPHIWNSFHFNTLATEFVPGADAWLQSNCAGQQSPKCEAFDIGSEEEDHTCKAAHHAWSLSASTDWTATGRSDKVESALMQKIEKETSKNRKVGPVLQQCSSGAAGKPSPACQHFYIGDGDGKKACWPDGKTAFLPSELWPLLLDFLPVTEVVTMETRAVCSFFSNSKVWVSHLFKLMDLDSLPEHCAGDRRHPGLEFVKYFYEHDGERDISSEGEEEAKRNASEGFQGYRIWINGLFAWHKSYPEMSLHFLQMLGQWFGSTLFALAKAALILGDAVRYRGVRDLTLPLANGLLTGIHADMTPDLYRNALDLLKTCEPIYPHLNVTAVWTAVLKLLESVVSWEDRKVRRQTLCTVVRFLEATMIDDEAMALATQNLISILLADARGNLDEAAAKNQKLIGLLRQSNVRS